MKLRFRVEPAPDAGLIGNHDQHEAAPVQFAGTFECARHEHQVLAPIHVFTVEIDYAVAIEKRSATKRFRVGRHVARCSSQRM